MPLFYRLISISVLASCAACSTIPSTEKPPHFLLLGEVHDNPDGHQARYDYLDHLVQSGWRPVIAMEQFDLEQNAELQKAMQSCSTADCVIKQVGKNAWEWPLYRPVIQLAITYHLPVVAANLSRKKAFSIVQNGLNNSLTPTVIQQFDLPESINKPILFAQRNEINASHCGLAPENMLDGLATAQIARDIMMAETIITYGQQHDVVLLAGNGHVRKDIGVPYWLRQQHQTHIKAVGFTEKDTNMPTDSFDQQVTIPTHDRPDMCKNVKMNKAQ